mmetsp:Transcript_34331/g.80332  ORF Transcript_34331/g.80332 Transcript_34331/m.80332 type:complete len:950 (-) Transcript_34331:7-2856(-)
MIGCLGSDKAWESEPTHDGVRLAVHVPSRASSKHSRAEVRRYLEEDKVGSQLLHLVTELLLQEPDDPLKFLLAEAQFNHAVHITKVGSGSSSVRQGTSSNVAHLLDLPWIVTQFGRAKVVDLGVECCSFYDCRLGRDGKIEVRWTRREASFFSSFVDGWRTDAFADALQDAFRDLRPSEVTHATSEIVNTGTGSATASSKLLELDHGALTVHLGHAAPSTQNEAQHGRAQEFLLATQNHLHSKGVEVNLKLFAPSQLLIVKLELFASEWLASHSDFLHLMPKNVEFTGILSSHNFASTMAMIASSRVPSMQLWSLPLGCLVPIAEGIFSSPEVQEHEQIVWRNRVRNELSKANFGMGIGGLWVGIALTYDTVCEVGCADMVLSKTILLERLEAARQVSSPTKQRFLSTLILLQEMIKVTFNEHSWFVFKRRWRVDVCKDELETNWPLGLFAQQLRARKVNKPTAKMQEAVVSNPNLGQRRLLSPWNMPAGAFFEVPYIAWPTGAALILDFGTGETGVYRFEPDIQNGGLTLTHEAKLPHPLVDSFVSKGLVSEFVTTIMDEFKLRDLVQNHGWRRVLLVGGATGAHRGIMTQNSEVRENVMIFLGKAEEAMSAQLAVPVCIRMFIPSGEFEAELELRSVEWLMSQPDLVLAQGGLSDMLIDRTFQTLMQSEGHMSPRSPRSGTSHKLEEPEPVSKEAAKRRLHFRGVSALNTSALDCEALEDMFDADGLKKAAAEDANLQALVRSTSFCGTISAGGGSCQLALAGLTRDHLVQLYSMPAGNRSPVDNGLFPKKGEVSREKQLEWTLAARGLLASHFPQQKLQGFYVGISAVYHAAKSAGVADRFVSQSEAVGALTATLAKLERTDVRSIANITLVKEMIEGLFEPELTLFLFKRNWKVGDCTYVAGWTLGLYSSQFDVDSELREAAATQVQRFVRGHLQRRAIVVVHSI